VKQALDGIRARLAQWNSTDHLPAFGRPIAVVVNYSPDRAIQFDLKGNPMLVFDRANRPGDVRFSIGRRAVTEGELAAVFSSH
jgi:hypothetical protein